MKKLSIIAVVSLSIAAWGCSDIRREPARAYMPDMSKSRAYETYANLDTLKSQGIHYTAMPVAGTVKRGELYPFPIPIDKVGDSVNYVASRAIENPLTTLTPVQATEAERLYLVNCAICHGANLKGNGPLYNDGAGPYGVAPKNLVDDAIVKVMPEGQLFYSVTYGKGQMGPYASQLTTTQRWMVVKYVKQKQLGITVKSGAAKDSASGMASGPAAGSPATGAAGADSGATGDSTKT
ncbi:MAG: cytochrome c, partial [Sphingobacteriales bacterium]